MADHDDNASEPEEQAIGALRDAFQAWTKVSRPPFSETFNGKGDVLEFLEGFDKYRGRTGIDDDDARRELISAMRGEAFRWAEIVKEGKNVTELYTELENRYAPKQFEWQRKLEGLKQGCRSVDEFATSLLYIMRKAKPNMSQPDFEKEAINYFVEGLELEPVRMALYRKPKVSYQDTVAEARDWENAHKRSRLAKTREDLVGDDDEVCLVNTVLSQNPRESRRKHPGWQPDRPRARSSAPFRPRGDGNAPSTRNFNRESMDPRTEGTRLSRSQSARPRGAFRRYPSVERCINCGRRGHVRANCRQEGETCFNCRQIGHISKDCPTKVITCYRCGQTGHLAGQCSVQFD